MLPSSFSINDEIRIVSILYEYMIYCSDIKSINDLYNIINEYHLDVNLFNNPYYLSVSLKSFNETTINIINQLNDETFVEIELCHSTSTNNEILQLLSRISHKRVLFSSNNWINLDILHFVTNNYEFDRESYPLIAIDRIDSTTANKIIDVCKKIDRPSFRIEIKDVVNDNRKISEGSLLICIKGANFDGHSCAMEAAQKNAAAIVVEHDVELPDDCKMAVIRVENTRYAMAFISAAYFDHPARKLKTIGITGTKGKTTTTYLIRNMLQNAGHKVGLIGTIEVYGDRLQIFVQFICCFP